MPEPDDDVAESHGRDPPRSDGPEAGEDERDPEAALEEVAPDRRRFLQLLSLGIGAAAGTSLLVPWARLYLSPAEQPDPRAWREVGRVEEFTVGRTVEVGYLDPAPLPWAGYVARNAAWLRREGADEFTAFTTYCTHLGCPIRWEEGARLFLCPCHGGAFYEDGAVAAGPPPRSLDRYPVRIREGIVEVQAVGIPSPE